MVKLFRSKSRGKVSAFWSADFVLPTGERVRKSTGCTERSAAARVAGEWARQAQHAFADEAQGIERPVEIALLALADDYIDAMRVERAHRYVDSLLDHLRAYILPHFGPKTLASAITRRDVEAFRQALLEGAIETRSAATRRTGLPAPATVNRCMVTLRRMLDHGLRRGHLKQNVAANMVPLKERTHERHRALSDKEIAALIDELGSGRRNADDNVLWFRFMIATGLRNDEGATLLWTDVDLQARRLLVRSENAKGARSRRVPLTDAAIEALEEVRAGQPSIGLVFGPRDRRTALLGAWARTGLPGRAPTAHDLRHTCASRAAAVGLDLVQLMSWFGWESPTVATRYLHLYGDRWADMAAKMDAGRKR